MKKIITLAVALIASATMFAQTVSETPIQIGDISTPAYTVKLDKDEDLVADALKQLLKDNKLKTTKSNGFQVALAQVYSAIAPTPVNFYTKIETQGRKSEKRVVVTFAAISSDLSVEQATIGANTQKALTEFVAYVERYDAKKRIAEEEKALKKATKTAAAAASTLAGIEKDIKKTEEKMADRQKEIDKLNAKLAEYNKELETMKSSMESYNTKKANAEKKVEETQAAVQAVQERIDGLQQKLQ